MRLETLAAFYVSLACAPPVLAEPADSSSRQLLRLAVFKQALTRLSDGDSLAIVRFHTDLRKSATGREMASLTRAVLQDGQLAVHVQGSFVVLATLVGKPMAKEHISRTIPFELNEAGLNAALLLRAIEAERDPICLAIHPNAKNKRSFVDGLLVGPILLADLKSIVAAARTAQDETVIPEQMIESSNPWTVYVGVAQLDIEKRLSVPHFWTAITGLPVEYTENLIDDLLSSSAGNARINRSMDSHFLKLIQALDAGRQKALLAELNTFCRRNPHLIGRWFDFSGFRRGLSVYRTTIAADQSRASVVTEIDKILELQHPLSK